MYLQSIIATMNRIIFYSFILAALSTSLHGRPNTFQEMIKDVNKLKKLLQGDVPQLCVPPVDDSGDLSCFVAELGKFLKIDGIGNKIQKTIKRLIKKTTLMKISADNCIAHTNQRMSNQEFLKQMLIILQNKYRQ